MPTCPICGTKVSEGAGFCPKCLRRLMTEKAPKGKSKKKLIGIIVACVMTITIIVVAVKYLPTLTREDSQEPEQIRVSAYNFSKELFAPELTDWQRETLWANYEGKQIKWTNELRGTALEEKEVVAYFANPLDRDRTEIKAVFDGSKASSLLECKEGDLVTYTGILTSFGQAEISLADCTFVSRAIIPLWWNNDVDTNSKRILVGGEVLCFGPYLYEDVTGYGPPEISAFNKETGELLWESKTTETILVGIDSQHVYTCNMDVSSTMRASVVASNIEALNKTSGQIVWTSLVYDQVPHFRHEYEYLFTPWLLISNMGAEIINKAESDLILLMDKPPVFILDYPYEGIIYASGSSSSYGVFGEGHYALQALDQETGSVLWIATFGYAGITDFSIVDGILYVSTDNGIGAFELPNLADLQNPNSSATGI